MNDGFSYDRSDPDAWAALAIDQSVPFEPAAKLAWLKDSSSWSRQFLLPILRPFLHLTIGLVQLWKVVFPNLFTSSKILHHLLAFLLKTFVTPEGNFMLLRHFHLGSQVLDFLRDNIKGVEIVTVPLLPEKLSDFKENLIIKHDINLYNFIIDLNREIQLKNLQIKPPDKLDFKSIHTPPLKLSDFPKGLLNCIDITTAIEIITPLFQLLLTDREFWRSTHSLQFDETIGIYFAHILNAHTRLFLVNNKHPLVPDLITEAPFRLVLHALSTEILHGMLVQLKQQAGH